MLRSPSGLAPLQTEAAASQINNAAGQSAQPNEQGDKSIISQIFGSEHTAASDSQREYWPICLCGSYDEKAVFVVLVFPLFGVAIILPALQPAPTILAIIHVTVIDATGAEAALDQTVVIKGDRISSIGKTGHMVIPKGASTVDATGKFLIPGLWDMHLHTLQDERPKLFFPLLISTSENRRSLGSP